MQTSSGLGETDRAARRCLALVHLELRIPHALRSGRKGKTQSSVEYFRTEHSMVDFNYRSDNGPEIVDRWE